MSVIETLDYVGETINFATLEQKSCHDGPVA